MAAAGNRLASDTASIHINTITEGVGTRRFVQYFWAAAPPPGACPKEDPACTFDGQTPDELRMLGLDPDADLPSTTLMVTGQGWPRCRICGWSHYPDSVRSVKGEIGIAESDNDATLEAGINAAAAQELASRESMTEAVHGITSTTGVRWCQTTPLLVYVGGALVVMEQVHFDFLTKSISADSAIRRVIIVAAGTSSADIVAAMKAAVSG